jgi:hypothetical protein
MNQDPYLPPGVRQRDLDGPAMSEDEREQARREADDRAYENFKDQMLKKIPNQRKTLYGSESSGGYCGSRKQFHQHSQPDV